MVVCIFDLSTPQAEGQVGLSSKSAWYAQKDPGQTGPNRDSIFKKIIYEIK